MPDISMCNTADCLVKRHCHRHPDSGTKPSTIWQAWRRYIEPPESQPSQCSGWWPKAPLAKNETTETPNDEFSGATAGKEQSDDG